MNDKPLPDEAEERKPLDPGKPGPKPADSGGTPPPPSGPPPPHQ